MALVTLDVINEVRLRLRNPELDPILSDISLMLSLVSRQYEQVLDQHPWSFLRLDQSFATVAPYTTGTITRTLGSASVVGVGTAWTGAQVGMWLQIADQPPIQVSTVTDATHLTLEAPYPDQTDTSPTTYKLIQFHYSMPTAAKTTLHISNLRFRLRQSHQGFLRAYDPTLMYSTVPKFWAPTTSNPLAIDLWPVPDRVYLHRIVYLQQITKPTTLDATLTWGLGDPFWLYDLVMGEVYRLAYARTGREHYRTLADIHTGLGNQSVIEQDDRDYHNRFIPEDLAAMPYSDVPADMTGMAISNDVLQRLGI